MIIHKWLCSYPTIKSGTIMIMNRGNWKDNLVYILGAIAMGMIGLGAMALKTIGKWCGCF